MAAVAACSSVQNSRIGVLTPDSSETNWGPVADYLDHRCGTIDCHGNPARNLRIYGCNGMRLSDADIASCIHRNGGSLTTPAEHMATFRSLVGLEPTVMSEVVADYGQHPELLTFIRKMRGTEAHKGGQIDHAGDDQDICVTSWLTTGHPDGGQTDQTACMNAQGLPVFPLPDASPE